MKFARYHVHNDRLVLLFFFREELFRISFTITRQTAVSGSALKSTWALFRLRLLADTLRHNPLRVFRHVLSTAEIHRRIKPHG